MESGERELAAACARGDQGAWTELIRRYDGGVLHALRRAGGRDELDDLRQEVWVRLLARGALDRFRAEHAGALRVFLGRVARSVAIDHGRFCRLRPLLSGGEEPGELADGGPGPEAVVSASRARQRLSAALERTAAEGERPGRDRDILHLHFLEGHPAADIAAMGLGLSARGVEALLRRSRVRLEQILRADDP